MQGMQVETSMMQLGLHVLSLTTLQTLLNMLKKEWPVQETTGKLFLQKEFKKQSLMELSLEGEDPR